MRNTVRIGFNIPLYVPTQAIHLMRQEHIHGNGSSSYHQGKVVGYWHMNGIILFYYASFVCVRY